MHVAGIIGGLEGAASTRNLHEAMRQILRFPCFLLHYTKNAFAVQQLHFVVIETGVHLGNVTVCIVQQVFEIGMLVWIG